MECFVYMFVYFLNSILFYWIVFEIYCFVFVNNELILIYFDVIGIDLIWKFSCNEIELKKINNFFNNVVCYYKCGVLVYIESKFFKVVLS